MNSKRSQYKNAHYADSHVQTDCIYCEELRESAASASELAVNSASHLISSHLLSDGTTER